MEKADAHHRLLLICIARVLYAFIFAVAVGCGGGAGKPGAEIGDTGTDTVADTNIISGTDTVADTSTDTGQTNTSQMTVFQGLFPLTSSFRNGPSNSKDPYEKWLTYQPFVYGHLPDLITYSLIISPENYAHANRFAKEHPETLTLSTVRASSGTPSGVEPSGDKLEKSNITFPGHWVLSPGSTLSGALTAVAETLTVDSADGFTVGPALLVETDESGAKLWQRFEYVLIKKLVGNTLTVERAFNGSPAARDFPADKTYVAPIPWDTRSTEDYNNWYFNITADCPRDAEGKTASDVIFERLVAPLKKGGELEHFGGIDLASGPFGQSPNNADYDVDGEADPGRVYQEGVRAFYERIWSALGSSRVLMANLDFNFVGLVSGLDQEGLARPSDPWRGVSRTVNTVLAWRKLSPLPMVSLIFVQYLNAEEELIRVQLNRLLNGYAACLKMAANVKIKEDVDALALTELFKGDEKEAHWLGKALSPMKRPAKMTSNLLAGSGDTDWDAMLPKLIATRGTLVKEGNELLLKPVISEGDTGGTAKVELRFALEQKSDITVFFEARSEDDLVSREVTIPEISVPVETEPVRANITNLDYLPLSFYIRGVSPGDVAVTVRFATGGDIRFRSLSAHAAPDTLACEFEKGVVLVNPSLSNATFNLAELFPGRQGYRRLKAPAFDGTISDNLQQQYEQTLQLNNGETIGDPHAVTVPERNALFLIAKP